MRRDYYVEFYETVEAILDGYVTACDLPMCLKTVLFEGSYALRREYNDWRKSGISKSEAESGLRMKLVPEGLIDASFLSDNIRIDLSPFLNGLGNRIVFYIYNDRQLRYLLPIITSINRPTLLLCEPCVNLDIEVAEYVAAVELDLSIISDSTDSGLPKNLQNIRNYHILFGAIFECIHPEAIVVLEGCHYQEQILWEMAESLGIPSIVIQQGWPSFMHSMFRGFPYSHFLTWGERFNELWRLHNPQPVYTSVGYPHGISTRQPTGGIAFFLQSPLFISDEAYFEELLTLIVETAKRYPERKILVREHPEYRLSKDVIGSFARQGNIIVVSDWPLETAYSHSEIVVSHFSSSIMECLVHGCIPLVYDPTDDSYYTPDIKTLGYGRVAKSSDELFKSIDSVLEDCDKIHGTIEKDLNGWFEAAGAAAVDNIATFINNTAPPTLLICNTKLNLGCGRNIMSGWLNCDLYASHPDIFRMDAGTNYPFPDDTFDFIFSEHMFEHLTLQQQSHMLRECYRVLKPGGTMRLAMPNLEFLMDLYNHPDDELNKRYVDWSFHTFIGEKQENGISEENRPVYVINNFMRDWGHQFIHTPQTLIETCRSLGFINFIRSEIGKSRHDGLVGLEGHANEIPAWANELETFVVEMTKPGITI